jgi:hypothetical protein
MFTSAGTAEIGTSKAINRDPVDPCNMRNIASQKRIYLGRVQHLNSFIAFQIIVIAMKRSPHVWDAEDSYLTTYKRDDNRPESI